MGPEKFYSTKNREYTKLHNTVSAKIKRFAWYRLAAFLLIFLPFILLGFSVFSGAVALVFFILFLFLVKKNIRFERLKERYAALKQLTDDELKALGHQFSQFEDGAGFLDTNHFFSYDLDLFGNGSLYQFLNRTVTWGGRQKLAGWLSNPPFQKNEILVRQEAIQELAQIPQWRLDFLADGRLFHETKQLFNEVNGWSATQIKLQQANHLNWMIRIIPAITLLSLVPAIAGITNLPLYFLLLVQWVLVGSFWKTTGYFYSFFGRKSELFKKYIQLLLYIEKQEFQSEHLIDVKNRFTQPEAASRLFSQLKKGMAEFEYRQNLIVGIVLNSFFLWDLRCVYKLWNWHKKNHTKLPAWLDSIAETDALISLANFANNHPEYNYPEICEKEYKFKATNLGHPLLKPEKRVNNDFSVEGWGKVIVVTGANMAGKSTFLRTVGVNMVLARTGAPVCASEMVLTPVEIYTNMRTTDSLLKDESYFFAELKRLKGVLDKLENGESIFVILDEMLKGTNSVDKLNGSRELIRKLLKLNAVALIATHDLKLAEMNSEYPEQVVNKCFEIRIEHNELVFDYKLYDGATRTMNATFLMKKMGII